MKRILLLSTILLTVGLMSASAYKVNTKLTLRSHQNYPIQVTVDGQRYGHFSNQHQITNIAPGHRYVHVFAMVPGPGGRLIKKVIYNGTVNIKAGYACTAVVMPNGNLSISGLVALGPHGVTRHGYGVNPGVKIGRTLQGGPIVCATPGTGVHGGYGQVPPQVAQPIIDEGPIIMTTMEFNQLLQVLDNQSFERTRLAIAKDAISMNYFTTEQVLAIMDQFWFESSKLEIAKLGYEAVIDPQRYYLVYDAFTFSSSVRELQAYLGR